MATSTGFSDGASDLLSKLRTFLLANSWVEMRYTAGSELIVKGIGGGSDEIYVGMKIFSDAVNDNYAWILQGFTGYNSSLSFENQPGNCGVNPPCLPLLQSSPVNANAIKYWFICNNRRFIVIARIGSTYQQAYMGWILPYGTPQEFPYPLLVGGSTFYNTSGNNGNTGPFRYSNTSDLVNPFWYPFGTATFGQYPSLALRDSGGTWQRMIIGGSVGTARRSSGVYPFTETYVESFGYGKGLLNLRPALDGSYSLTPLILVNYGTASQNMYGEFDGVKYVSGFNQNSENTITYNSDTWLVFNRVFRTNLNDFVAYKNV